MLSIGNISFNSQFTFAADGTVSLTTTPVPIGGGTITGPVVIKTNTAPSLPAPAAGTLLQMAAADTVPTRLTLDAFGTNPVMTFRAAQGTAIARTGLVNGQAIFALTAEGYGTSGYSSGARVSINANARQNWTDTAQGASISFFTTPIGTVAVAEAMRIADSGNVGIGTTGPLSRLDINGGVAIGTYAGTVAAPTNGLAVAGSVGIGTTALTAKVTITTNVSALQPPPASAILHLSAADGGATRVLFDSYGSYPTVYLRRANGTAVAPTALAANDPIGLIGGIGYGASAYSTNPMVYLAYYASEAWTATAQGALMQFVTTPNGSVTPAERMRIDNAGNVGIGMTGPAYPLEVAGIIGSTGGAPALYLTETDVAADNKIWRLGQANGTLFLQTLDDAKVSAQPAFAFTRSGISITSAALYTNNTERLRIDSSGNVGIGTALPGAKLTVSTNTAALPAPPNPTSLHIGAADGSFPRVTLDGFAGYGLLSFRRANTTAAAPSAIASNDILGAISVHGFGASAYGGAVGSIFFYAAEAWTNTAQGTYINFVNTPIGSVTPVERMRIDHNGNVGIGTGSPLAKLHLSKAGALNFAMQDTTQATDAKIWDFYCNASNFNGRVINDAYNLGTNWVGVSRTGIVVDNITHGANAHSFYNSGNTIQYLGVVGSVNQGAQLNIAGQATTGDAALKIGGGRTGSGNAIIDLVGDTTYPAYGLRILRANTGADAPCSIIHRGLGAFAIQTNEAANISFNTTALMRLYIHADGGVVVGSPTGATKGVGTLNAVTVYAAGVALTSDANLKTDIEPIKAAMTVVKAVEPKSFRWKDLEDTTGQPPGFSDRLNRGFLAQDVAAALGGDPDTVDLGGMVATLWQAVRELMVEIDALKTVH